MAYNIPASESVTISYVTLVETEAMVRVSTDKQTILDDSALRIEGGETVQYNHTCNVVNGVYCKLIEDKFYSSPFIHHVKVTPTTPAVLAYE